MAQKDQSNHTGDSSENISRPWKKDTSRHESNFKNFFLLQNMPTLHGSWQWSDAISILIYHDTQQSAWQINKSTV